MKITKSNYKSNYLGSYVGNYVVILINCEITQDSEAQSIVTQGECESYVTFYIALPPVVQTTGSDNQGSGKTLQNNKGGSK